MSLISQLIERLSNRFDGYNWVIRNNVSSKNIETCNGAATGDPLTHTCAKCVAANKTAYRTNEVCTDGHLNCKCTYENGNVVVKVDFPMSKLTGYLFKDANKTKMMHKIGYRIEDSEALHQTLSAVIKKQYEEGNYRVNYLNNNGVHVQIDTVIIGKRDHEGELHKCHVGCVLWPYGKIKVGTPLVVDDI